jgi:hypothetical protein
VRNFIVFNPLLVALAWAVPACAVPEGAGSTTADDTSSAETSSGCSFFVDRVGQHGRFVGFVLESRVAAPDAVEDVSFHARTGTQLIEANQPRGSITWGSWTEMPATLLPGGALAGGDWFLSLTTDAIDHSGNGAKFIYEGVFRLLTSRGKTIWIHTASGSNFVFDEEFSARLPDANRIPQPTSWDGMDRATFASGFRSALEATPATAGEGDSAGYVNPQRCR